MCNRCTPDTAHCIILGANLSRQRKHQLEAMRCMLGKLDSRVSSRISRLIAGSGPLSSTPVSSYTFKILLDDLVKGVGISLPSPLVYLVIGIFNLLSAEDIAKSSSGTRQSGHRSEEDQNCLASPWIKVVWWHGDELDPVPLGSGAINGYFRPTFSLASPCRHRFQPLHRQCNWIAAVTANLGSRLICNVNGTK
ncbi:hypothetical protein BaRGS_00000168 [Batillaria attramentaria]|uniref:Uncharacterized protein n=1 Tax=Batillaria attramentaria TaxID=370345 RepID=A0ABD0MBK4_9CAEN